MTERNRSGIQRWRVPLGFLAVAVFLALAHPTWRLIAIGLPLTLLGLAVRAWASGHLRKNAELATSGPYSFTRNPLYFGSLLMLAGVLISGANLWLAGALLALYLLVYYPVMRSESRHMQDLFKVDYERWAAEVPLFIPRLSPARMTNAQSYDLSLYLKHREYRALIGAAMLYAALGVKSLWQVINR
jgi:protein-S-isoprenylcysteine O-methyltransferase Ste14